MTEQKFKSEMRRAETMRRSSDPEMSEYWAGYMRGLRKAYHGNRFGTDEHSKWMSAIDSADEMQKQRGRGYHNGIKYGDLSSKIGRPSVGSVMLTSITVPEDLKSAIEAKAELLNMSIADARREAYRKFTEDSGERAVINELLGRVADLSGAVAEQPITGDKTAEALPDGDITPDCRECVERTDGCGELCGSDNCKSAFETA